MDRSSEGLFQVPGYGWCHFRDACRAYFDGLEPRWPPEIARALDHNRGRRDMLVLTNYGHRYSQRIAARSTPSQLNSTGLVPRRGHTAMEWVPRDARVGPVYHNMHEMRLDHRNQHNLAMLAANDHYLDENDEDDRQSEIAFRHERVHQDRFNDQQRRRRQLREEIIIRRQAAHEEELLRVEDEREAETKRRTAEAEKNAERRRALELELTERRQAIRDEYKRRMLLEAKRNHEEIAAMRAANDQKEKELGTRYTVRNTMEKMEAAMETKARITLLKQAYDPKLHAPNGADKIDWTLLGMMPQEIQDEYLRDAGILKPSGKQQQSPVSLAAPAPRSFSPASARPNLGAYTGSSRAAPPPRAPPSPTWKHHHSQGLHHPQGPPQNGIREELRAEISGMSLEEIEQEWARMPPSSPRIG